MQRIWMPCKILNLEFIDEDEGAIIAIFDWCDGQDEIRETVIDFMYKHNYTYMEHYTINNAGRYWEGTPSQTPVAIWFKNPEDFVMMKLAV